MNLRQAAQSETSFHFLVQLVHVSFFLPQGGRMCPIRNVLEDLPTNGSLFPALPSRPPITRFRASGDSCMVVIALNRFVTTCSATENDGSVVYLWCYGTSATDLPRCMTRKTTNSVTVRHDTNALTKSSWPHTARFPTGHGTCYEMNARICQSLLSSAPGSCRCEDRRGQGAICELWPQDIVTQHSSHDLTPRPIRELCHDDILASDGWS